MGEVVAKQFSALGQEVTAFFFFPIWTVHYVVIFSKTFCSQNTSPYSGIKWVSNNFQANLTKLYGGKDTSFSVRRTIWLGCKMFLFSNHLCSWAERLWESETFCPTYPLPKSKPFIWKFISTQITRLTCLCGRDTVLNPWTPKIKLLILPSSFYKFPRESVMRT